MADTAGATAIRYAAAKGQGEVVDILARAGAKWDCQPRKQVLSRESEAL